MLYGQALRKGTDTHIGAPPSQPERVDMDEMTDWVSYWHRRHMVREYQGEGEQILLPLQNPARLKPERFVSF